MTNRPFLTAAVAKLASLSNPIAADPVASNLGASQRPGNRLVDISQGVTAGLPTVKVQLKISSDGGASWAIPVPSVFKAASNGVTVGHRKTITLNLGADCHGKLSSETRFRVIENDHKPPPIDGFSWVSAGALPYSTSGMLGSNAPVSNVLFIAGEGESVIGAGFVKIPVAGRAGAFRTGAVVLSR